MGVGLTSRLRLNRWLAGCTIISSSKIFLSTRGLKSGRRQFHNWMRAGNIRQAESPTSTFHLVQLEWQAEFETRSLCQYDSARPAMVSRFTRKREVCSDSVDSRSGQQKEISRRVPSRAWTSKSNQYHLPPRRPKAFSRILRFTFSLAVLAGFLQRVWPKRTRPRRKTGAEHF